MNLPPSSDNSHLENRLHASRSRTRRGWLTPLVIERSLPFLDGLIIVAYGIVCSIGYSLATDHGLGRLEAHAAASILVAINFTLLITVQQGYRLRTVSKLPRQLRITTATWFAVFGVLLAIGFTMKVSETLSRGSIILFFISGLINILAWKSFISIATARALRSGAFATKNVIVIAESGLQSSSHAMMELRRHGFHPTKIVEIAAADLDSPLMMSKVRISIGELVVFARHTHVEQILLLLRWDRQHAIESLLDEIKILPLPVYLVPDRHVSRFLRYPLISTGNTWTAELRRAPLSWSERAVKRTIDLVGATIAIILFAPIMLAASLLIRASSSGPVLFRQTRHGFTGRDFRIFKFRTMRVLEDGPQLLQATRNDPRVTWIGKWLRQTSIDELPQLFNVIRGDMSLVGPRPHAAAHNSQYQELIGNYAFRHHVKPGITGWAQVNGYRGETRSLELMQKRIEYDLWYINNWTVALDIAILLKTIIVGFRQRSAY